jgi:hypothetical protein
MAGLSTWQFRAKKVAMRGPRRAVRATVGLVAVRGADPADYPDAADVGRDRLPGLGACWLGHYTIACREVLALGKQQRPRNVAAVTAVTRRSTAPAACWIAN